MTPEQLIHQTQFVLALTFGLAFMLGALIQRTGFCTMGAVSDVVVLGSWTRFRQWALATGTTMLVFAVFLALGWIRPDQTLYASTRWLWLSGAVGGALFGFGMVLSSGCMSKTLVRVGSGNLKSLLVMLLAGMVAFATLKGITAPLRVGIFDAVNVQWGYNADLGTVLAHAANGEPRQVGVAIGGVLSLGLISWALRDREIRRPWLLAGGVGVGLAVAAMWWVTGHLGHLAEHPETLEEVWLATNSTRAESFSFIAPTAYAMDWLLFFTDANKRLTVGIVSVAGVIVGSTASSVLRGDFRWEGFTDTADMGHHIAGAVLMGFGGVTAMGCSIGQGVTGLSTLSLTSFVAVPAMLAGAVAAVKYQEWRFTRGG